MLITCSKREKETLQRVLDNGIIYCDGGYVNAEMEDEKALNSFTDHLNQIGKQVDMMYTNKFFNNEKLPSREDFVEFSKKLYLALSKARSPYSVGWIIKDVGIDVTSDEMKKISNAISSPSAAQPYVVSVMNRAKPKSIDPSIIKERMEMENTFERILRESYPNFSFGSNDDDNGYFESDYVDHSHIENKKCNSRVMRGLSSRGRNFVKYDDDDDFFGDRRDEIIAAMDDRHSLNDWN